MDDRAIYDLAVRIIDGIKEDFQGVNYSELEGTLQVVWGEEKRFTASAFSSGDLDRPPQHTVRLTYELARQIYRDGEQFYDFLKSGIQPYRSAFLTYDPPAPPPLPESFTREDFQNNFLAAALTWVFAHEIGHLTQEHGYIRSKFGNTGEANLEIHECEVMSSSASLSPATSAIYHATELAADFEATKRVSQ
jgi:hypothetical protein